MNPISPPSDRRLEKVNAPWFRTMFRNKTGPLNSALPKAARQDRPSPGRAQPIASLEEAGRHAEAWCGRTGSPLALDVPDADADAARQGWPDADGKGWTPPWDLLDMEPPDWWGRP